MRIHSRSLLSLGLIAILGAACSGGDDDTDDNTDDNTTPNNVKIDNFSADRATVAPGATVVLTYKVSNATNLTISAAPGGALLTESTVFEGTVTSAAINETTVFTISANGTGGPKTQTVMVTVDQDAVEVLTFVASPNPATTGDDIELSWTTAGATQIRVLQGTTQLFNSTTEVASGSFTVEDVLATTTYTLEATNATKNDSATVTVDIEVAGFVQELRAFPAVFTGASANITVSWRAFGADFALTANGDAVANFPGATTSTLSEGSITVNVTETTLFELSATGAGVTDTALAAVASGVAETEPNDDSATATAITGGASGMITPATDVDFYSFTVPASGNVFAETTDGNGGCAFDSVIRLYDSTGVELGMNDERGLPSAGGIGSCSQINPVLDAFARDLAAGTYYISVESYMQMETGPYALVVITAAGECGNGILEVSLTEQCDDGNVMPNDGCSPTCQLQILGTVSGLDQEMTFDNALDPGTQTDYFQVDLPSAGFIDAETGAPTVGMCSEGTDTVITLYDATFTVLGIADDIAGADNRCSHLDPNRFTFASVAAGTYYISVTSFSQDPVAAYQIRIATVAPGCGNAINEAPTEQCDDGNMTAGDGCAANCQLELAGTINPPGGSVDVMAPPNAPGTLPAFIAIVITTPGSSITATTSDGAGACPLPTAVGLFTSDTLELLGVSFATDACASLDPLTNPEHAFASDLPAGTYLLGVVGETDMDMGMVTVDVMISDPDCGNNVLERNANEQCEDGNNTNGDGCTAACQFEGIDAQEVEPNDDTTTASPSGATNNQTVSLFGAIDPVADVDVWSLNVPAGATLQAKTYPTLGDPLSCGPTVDTVIFLLDSAGTVLTTNDDLDVDVGDYCSFIDGTVDPAADNLPAGTYYIRVEHYSGADVIPGYFMDLTLQ